MSFDDTLFAISLTGIILSLAYFRAAFRQWRLERALELRRLNPAGQLSNRAVAGTAGVAPQAAGEVSDQRTCTVLDFKGSGARKARDALEIEAGGEVIADVEDTRQRGGRTL